ncbi:reverse transcriptase [Plakobranchus ocellatus]|uniref:Reverse transcriptase n=1 Tax=Plakobranchus ocellatus TaxID=259542 RepID=A0AAV4D733_9GAST|nr:reverse transcriptase [Plakobranchus ocellatus]
MNNEPPTLDKLNTGVKKATGKFLPGPNGIPYLLYKRCPNILRWLHKIFRSAWNNLKISEKWMTPEKVYIPKDLSVPTNLIAKSRRENLLLNHGITPDKISHREWLCEVSVQKGDLPKISDCLEHTTMIWETIQRAKSGKRNLDVVWLDFANAYGSVPHQMIQEVLRMYHFPEDIQVMREDFFSEFKMGISNERQLTHWINVEVGIGMGCTISPLLFVMAGFGSYPESSKGKCESSRSRL